MPQRTPRVRLIETSHPRYKWAVTYSCNGVRRTAYFKSGEKKQAETKRSQMEAEVYRLGTEVVAALDDSDRRFLADAKLKLKQHGKTLRDAIDHYFESLKINDRRCTVGEMTDKLVAFKSREGVSKRYQYDLEQKLFKFCRAFGTRQIADITTEQVSDWLQKLHDDGLAPTSINCYRRALSVLFGFGVSNGYITSNAAKYAFKPKVRTSIGILAPDEMRRLLEVAHPDIVPTIAIAGFAGLRRSEIERLKWHDIDFGKGLIRLDADQTKTATCRDVRIMPNLQQWLAPYSKTTGSVWPEEHERGRNLLDAAKRAAGFGTEKAKGSNADGDSVLLKRWPHNALRHSFGSYHYAAHEDAAQASAQMGHSNVTVFWSHYRKKASREEADAFWAITPVQVVVRP